MEYFVIDDNTLLSTFMMLLANKKHQCSMIAQEYITNPDSQGGYTYPVDNCTFLMFVTIDDYTI